MHQIIEVNPIQAGRASPARNLAVDVIEPETQMSQRHAQHEPRSRAHADRNRRAQAGSQGGQRDLVRRKAKADGSPGAIDGRRPGDSSRQPVADLAMPLLLNGRA